MAALVGAAVVLALVVASYVVLLHNGQKARAAHAAASGEVSALGLALEERFPVASRPLLVGVDVDEGDYAVVVGDGPRAFGRTAGGATLGAPLVPAALTDPRVSVVAGERGRCVQVSYEVALMAAPDARATSSWTALDGVTEGLCRG